MGKRMIEGIEILNKTKIYEMSNVAENVAIISAIILSISFILMIISLSNDEENLAIIFSLIMLCSLIIALVAFLLPEKDSGIYTYKCTISENVNFNDVYENYNVIGQEGKIWTLEDKEVNNE